MSRLLHEQNHGLHLTDEEEDIYEHGFQSHGVTPRQFAKLLKASLFYIILHCRFSWTLDSKSNKS